MTVQSIVIRVLVAAGLSLAPAAMLRKDSVKLGVLTTFAALVGCAFSGGYLVAAVAAVVLFIYQLYLRVVVLRLRWVFATCLALLSYIGAQAAFLPARLEVWETSFGAKVFIASIPVAVSMLVTCIELKIRRLKETAEKDLTALGEKAGEYVKEKLQR